MPEVKHTASKAHGGGAGGGVASALALILVYFLELDPAIEGALAIIIAAVGGWLGAYYAPRNQSVEAGW